MIWYVVKPKYGYGADTIVCDTEAEALEAVTEAATRGVTMVYAKAAWSAALRYPDGTIEIFVPGDELPDYVAERIMSIKAAAR